jgi:hypothetical protein
MTFKKAKRIASPPAGNPQKASELCKFDPFALTPAERQARRITARFGLPFATARAVATLAYDTAREIAHA